MEFWDDIVNTAMIGTDKKQTTPALLPQELAEATGIIQANTALDKEEMFLQTAAVALNFRQSGFVPVHNASDIEKAPSEEKKYCSNDALQCLKNILSEESVPLLQLWLEQCESKQRVVSPVLVPALLAAAVQQKKLQLLVHACCGRRGEWLGKFNTQWNFSSGDAPEQVWQTGTMEMRKNIFGEIRKANPAQALEWLQQTWKEEDANAKTAFLELMYTGISEADLPFLESLSGEKSKKVKDEAMHLQRCVPSSPIVTRYQQALAQRVHLKKEKALLGLMNKSFLLFNASPLEDDIYKSGIEKLSNSKEFTDDEYILFQLTESVPPSFWEKQWQCKPREVIDHFQKNEVAKKLVPAIVNAAVKFNDRDFAIALMQYSEVFYIDILPLLPSQQQEHYGIKFFSGHPDSILQYALQYEKEWSLELATLIFNHASKNPYQYSKSFFNIHIHLIPASVIPELEKLSPAEDYYKTMWTNTCAYITKLVQLKHQTINAFKV
ncbi:MAG: hypothetical protein IT249_05115 [Chitinophagaceae bacterium]|nr:hypothetical protein [Chitinophagaceae bacterium]